MMVQKCTMCAWNEQMTANLRADFKDVHDDYQSIGKELHKRNLELEAVKKERDELHDALKMVCKIECVDDLWKAQEALAKIGAEKGE